MSNEIPWPKNRLVKWAELDSWDDPTEPGMQYRYAVRLLAVPVPPELENVMFDRVQSFFVYALPDDAVLTIPWRTIAWTGRDKYKILDAATTWCAALGDREITLAESCEGARGIHVA